MQFGNKWNLAIRRLPQLCLQDNQAVLRIAQVRQWSGGGQMGAWCVLTVTPLFDYVHLAGVSRQEFQGSALSVVGIWRMDSCDLCVDNAVLYSALLVPVYLRRLGR